MENLSTKEFAQRISQLPRVFVLTSHKNPDGDGLGAMFAMGEGLKVAGKEVHYVLDEEVRDYYHFLPEHKFLQFDLAPISEPAVLMTFDCGSKERIGLPEGVSVDNFLFVNLDHHLSNERFGDITVIRTDSVASCELVYETLTYMGLTLSSAMATSLYMGLVYDTGRFAYSEDPKTFQLAEALIRCGADHWAVYTSLFRHNDFEEFRTHGELISRLQQSFEGKVVTLDVTEDITQSLDLEETENLINQISNIRDLEIAVIFKYMGPAETKVSLRSRGRYSVCDVASAVGGGGHRNASGAVVGQYFATTRKMVMDVIKNVINE
mgnify:CR=1 FL=1